MELIDEIEEGLFHKAIFQLKNGLKIFFLIKEHRIDPTMFSLISRI